MLTTLTGKEELILCHFILDSFLFFSSLRLLCDRTLSGLSPRTCCHFSLSSVSPPHGLVLCRGQSILALSHRNCGFSRHLRLLDRCLLTRSLRRITKGIYCLLIFLIYLCIKTTIFRDRRISLSSKNLYIEIYFSKISSKSLCRNFSLLFFQFLRQDNFFTSL